MLKPFYADDLMTIYHADCRDHLAVLETAAVMVTDPPYGYAYSSNMGGRFKGQQIANDDDVSARDDAISDWGDGPALVFGSWKRPRPDSTREVLIWDKGEQPGMGDLKLPWGGSHEEIYVLGEGFVGKRGPSVLRYQRINGPQLLHPNEKPIPLMRDLIEKCPPGVVIDPFMGSGSTLVACQQLGRRCIGFDVDEKWCRLARDRLAQAPLFV